MAKKEDFNLANFTEDELIKARNKLDAEYGKYIEECSREISVLVNEQKVDVYSFFGEKKVNKIIKKYTNITADIKNAIEDIERELQRRDNYKFEQSFIGGKKYHDDTISEKEFLEKEQLKTMKYKQSIEDDE